MRKSLRCIRRRGRWRRRSNDHERRPPVDPRKVYAPNVMRRGAAGETRPPVVAEVRESDPTNPNLNPTSDADEFSAMHHRYFIYEAAVDGSWVRQLTGGPDDPMTTPNNLCTVLIEDADPYYLPAPADVTTSANVIPVGCASAGSTIRRCCTESRAGR